MLIIYILKQWMMKNLITYNKPNDYPHVFAPKFNPEIWNKNLTTVHKDHNIGLQKNQMHSVKAAYVLQRHVTE